jgi:hypothetical protein
MYPVSVSKTNSFMPRIARLTVMIASVALILSACGGGGGGGGGGNSISPSGTTTTNNSSNTNTSASGTTITSKEYEGTYTISSSDVTISFKVSSNGTITSCYSDAVYVCSGQVDASGSFNITGNDGESPIDTSATLEGLINPSNGTVTGSFKATSVSDGASGGTFTGSKTTPTTSSSTTAASGSTSTSTSSSSAGSSSSSSTCTLANATLGTGPALSITPPAPCYKSREYTFGWTEKGVIGDACRAAQTPSRNDDLVIFKAKNISACYCKPNAKVNSVTMSFVCHVFFDAGS